MGLPEKIADGGFNRWVRRVVPVDTQDGITQGFGTPVCKGDPEMANHSSPFDVAQDLGLACCYIAKRRLILVSISIALVVAIHSSRAGRILLGHRS
jgi:hypothetical protein